MGSSGIQPITEAYRGAKRTLYLAQASECSTRTRSSLGMRSCSCSSLNDSSSSAERQVNSCQSTMDGTHLMAVPCQ